MELERGSWEILWEDKNQTAKGGGERLCRSSWAIAASTSLDLFCYVASAGEGHEGYPWEDSLAIPMGTVPGVIPANKSTI